MAIFIDHVIKNFGAVRALDDISLQIPTGDLFFLLGPSGCGKTTLLRAIAGFEDIDAGAILFDNKDISSVPPHKRNTAMVFQGYALWPHMTVAQNVAFGLEIQKISKPELTRKVGAALEKVQISDLANRKPNELSGGQQQRVALARTLIVEPTCLLLDEPLANLDAKLRREMRTEIRKICKQSGLTAVYVTHDRKEALSMADHLAVLDQGRVLQIGAPHEVYARPANAFVANFIGESNFVAGKIVDKQDGSLTLETGLGNVVSTVPCSDLKTGDTVTVSLRPEALRIGTDLTSAHGDNAFDATLIATTYLGELAEHLLAVNDNLTLKAFELNPRKLIQPGKTLRLSVAASDVVVLPNPPPTPSTEPVSN